MTTSSQKQTMAFDVRSTDFHAAMRRNRRGTIILLVVFAVLSALFAYVMGWGAQILAGAHPGLIETQGQGIWTQIEATLVSSWGLKAAGAGVVVAVLWTLFALHRADRAILKLAGANEVGADAEPVLHNVVEEMAIAAGLPKPRVNLIETDGLNAFATGLKPEKGAITVTRGLMERLNREELQAVIGHEMAHIANRDVSYMVVVATIAGMIAAASQIVVEYGWHAVFARGSRDAKPGPMIFVVLAVWLLFALLMPAVLFLIRMAVSREREFLADATAVKLTRNPQAMASALAKISDKPQIAYKGGTALNHLCIASPMKGVARKATKFFSTHPPIDERIGRVLNLE